ncbi:hypothetical protein GOALK_048_00080 [Gordonia alkanivorans NBRC 16433]|uniref:N-acetyltransferase domain-containing protein n=1 Tax=Gordonia alkanivorans NBRC 16433 TaxID=1027371 RepID=F9VTV7_9ACTN|nr:hypothetical protein GOALK_048_00080 [Gordonia alkanivorans NBRC 16433]
MGSEYTVIAAAPGRERALWDRYLNGAAASYERHGCAAALDYDEVSTGAGTALFFAVLDDADQVRGGLRVQPRFSAAAQSHALVEWAGQPGQVQLVNAIESRLAGGIVEVKTAWVDESSPIARSVAGQLSRLGLVIMEMSGTDHMMATAADHVLRRWQSGGGRVDESVPPTPFPDERYRTRLMWWDRARIREHTSPETWRRMRMEADILQTPGAPQLLPGRVSISTKSAGRW